MLQGIRDNSQKWIIKLFVYGIILLMILPGLDAIVSSFLESELTIAQVNGEEITQEELKRSSRILELDLLQEHGQNLSLSLEDKSLLEDIALKNLINRKSLLQIAKKINLCVRKKDLDPLILGMPIFQIDGKFNTYKFNAILEKMGYTKKSFIRFLREEILINQLYFGLIDSGFITKKQVHENMLRDKETRSFDVARIVPDTSGIKIYDKDVVSYYNKYPNKFLSQENLKLEFIELNRDDYEKNIRVEDYVLNEMYQKKIAVMKADTKYHVGDILLKGKTKEVKDKADQIRFRLESGEDFETLAKEYSQELNSASKGGDLGVLDPGGLDIQLKKSLISLKKGEISSPILIGSNYHIIKVIEILSFKLPKFEDIKSELEVKYKKIQADRKFLDACEELKELSFEEFSIEELAKIFQVPLKKISRSLTQEGRAGVLTSNKDVLKAAFTPGIKEGLTNSPLIHITPSKAIVFHTRAFSEKRKKDLNDVYGQIKEEIRLRQAKVKSLETAKRLINGMEDGQLSSKKLNWNHFSLVRRDQKNIDPALIESVFSIPKDNLDKQRRGIFTHLSSSSPDEDVLIIRLLKVNDSNISDSEKLVYDMNLLSYHKDQLLSETLRSYRRTSSIKYLAQNE